MALVNDEPGFTQLTKLNVTDTFLINGDPVTPDTEEIIEAVTPYTLLGTENVISLTGTGNVNLLLSTTAKKSVILHAATGTLTLVTQGGDTINQTVITVGNSAHLTPLNGQWVAV